MNVNYHKLVEHGGMIFYVHSAVILH